ncbi:MAG: glycogen debranching enzyme family protein [Deltaproteobacteria bacterium]|nr:glycogen debranching enzyme family protein [Deltaproteobacteria bacterium]
MVPVTRVGWRRGEDENSTDALINHEWLVANGLGGYASGTLAGVVTRRYHGLLVAALPNPFGRTMMFDHLVEQIRLPDGTLRRLNAEEQDGQVAWHGTEYLEEFRLDMGLPVWTYLLDGFLIEKRVVLTHMQNTVYVRYRLLDSPPPSDGPRGVWLFLRPAMHFRPHDAPVSRPIEPYTLSLTGHRFEVSTGSPLPSLKIRVDGDRPTFEFYPERQEKVNYRWEAARGYEAHGSLWSPGQFRVHLTAQTDAVLVASTETWETMGAIAPQDAWRYENERRARLLHTAGALDDATTAELVLAADQFLIAPAGRTEDAARARAQGEELRTVIAGYHWFTDWGRDTMISLEGLTLSTGRFRTANFILRTFARYVADGLIPNLFPEGSQEGLYHTADATLWFFHAVDRYLAYTSDRETLRVLLPTLERVIDAHLRGTKFGIGVDATDGLLRQGQEGFALTWMDALCDGWVVTPRRGKAVEINALWFNALTLMGRWAASEGRPGGAERYQNMAEKTKESFNRVFWNESAGCLYDVVGVADAPDGTNVGRDDAVRPNQILAVSLPNPVLDAHRWRSVVDKVGETLVTPRGLRSLAPAHPDFKPNYHGDLRTRDAAYHQGTVWSWLIGPFVDAWMKVYPDRRDKARDFLTGLRDHLGEACIGSVSEIFDAEPPFLPRGCVAQAWGIAEFLRVWRLTAPPPNPPHKGEPIVLR